MQLHHAKRQKKGIDEIQSSILFTTFTTNWAQGINRMPVWCRDERRKTRLPSSSLTPRPSSQSFSLYPVCVCVCVWCSTVDVTDLRSILPMSLARSQMSFAMMDPMSPTNAPTGGAVNAASKNQLMSQFAELNALKTLLKEQTVKYDNQTELLHTEEKKNRALITKLTALTEKDELSRMQKENFRLQSERLDSNAKVASIESMNDALKEENEQMKALLASERNEKATTNQAVETARRSEQKHKFNAGRWQREVTKHEATITKLESDLKAMKEELETKKVRLSSLEAEAAVMERIRNDKAVQDAGYGRLQAHLLEVARDAAKKQHALQNSLQATRQFLEELKVEYEEFSATSRMEAELYRRTKGAEYNKLKEDFDAYRRTQYEANEELLRHNTDIVHALQRQFAEYRTTAEHLFENEARSLEDKLKSMNEKHAAEIRLLVRAKDQQFSSMVSSKDAKIMNLIEGTDYQKVLVRHHTEIAQLKDQHEIDLKKVYSHTHTNTRGDATVPLLTALHVMRMCLFVCADS